MDELYDLTLRNMEETLHVFTQRVPPPQLVPNMGSLAFRYVEKSIHQALVQKLARYVSGLHATRLLMECGFVQEQAALQRILDEIREDIIFLAFAVINNDLTELHQRYLHDFFEEEFDADTPLASTQKRSMVPRKKIQAYLARIEIAALDPSQRANLFRTVSKAYSGFVHAASPQVMDMYGGNPLRFHVRGMCGTPRHTEHKADLWNYIYRGINVCGFVAKAFGDDVLFTKIREFRYEFERKSGKEFDS
jgi:hypothetical protein